MIGRTLIAAAALTAVTATAAPATVVEKGRFVDEPYGFSYDCGFPVDVEGIASGNYRLREGQGQDDSAYFSLDRIAFEEIHTNPQTGASFKVSGHFANNEVTAERVEGSVFEYRILKAGPVATIEDADGNVIYRDRGLDKRTILFDTQGDDEPGGEFVDTIDMEFAGPHDGFGRLCEVATELIG
jgi:hypothetical protein